MPAVTAGDLLTLDELARFRGASTLRGTDLSRPAPGRPARRPLRRDRAERPRPLAALAEGPRSHLAPRPGSRAQQRRAVRRARRDRGLATLRARVAPAPADLVPGDQL